MAKKNWIYIKRGLSEDPKHRAQMGECIWLFLHIIDRADFETGIAYDWKDAQEAAEMSMSLPTLRHQRRKLEELGYITAKKGMHKQDLIIHNWTNPRDYSGKKRNEKPAYIESDNPLSPESDNQSYNQSDNHPDSQVNTPTSNSESSSSSRDEVASVLTKHGNKLVSGSNEIIDEWLKYHTLERIEQAASKYAGKNVNYLDTVLIEWQVKGYPQTRQEKIESAKKQAAQNGGPVINRLED